MRVDDTQLLCLGEKARTNGAITGLLMKKSGEPRIQRWQRRYCCIYRNMLYYFESERSPKPNGVVFLEHCTCLVVPTADEKQFAFSVGFEGLGQRHFLFSTTTAADRTAWMDAIRNARMGNIIEECGELQRKVELLESQLEQLHNEYTTLQHTSVTSSQESTNKQPPSFLNSKLGSVLLSNTLNFETPKIFRSTSLPASCQMDAMSTKVDNEVAKIKKVQGYVRGFLLRKRFHKLVYDYIKSPHADSRKKRNHIMWSILKSEEEYVEHLNTLVNQFQHSCEIATTSRHPPLSMEACKRIFRNCEILLLIHKILLQGFHQRIAKWPVVVISDLMEQMIPMMSCYSTYVQDHVHAIETYFEVSKDSKFKQFLEHLHSKPATKGLLLSELIAVPLNRITVNMDSARQLLAHTPPEHVEYTSLQSVVKVLEQLHKLVCEEVSSTSNIRQTLEIERRIIGGCPALLDKEQVLVREGALKLVNTSKSMSPTTNRSNSNARACILFSKHLLIITRHVGFRSSAQYRLMKDIGVIPLAKCSLQSDSYLRNSKVFTLMCSTEQQPNLTISLMGDTVKRKAEWVADISQCIANERHYKMLADISSGKLVEIDSNKIKFCDYKTGRERMVSSASLDSLLQRLTTVGYSGMTFINTFLTTLPLFTDTHTVMDHLVDSYHQCLKPSLTTTESVFALATLSRNQNASDINIGSSLTLSSSGHHYITSQSATQPPKRPTISGVFFVLKHWISKYYYDFEGDANLLEKLHTLISKAEQNKLLIGGEQKALDHVKECLSSVQSEDVDSSQNVIVDLLKDQDKMESSPRWLLSFNSVEVAQQLTLIEQSYYMHIEPREVVTNAWSKKNCHDIAPNISQFFDNFNRNAYFLCWFILCFSQPEERARGLEYLMEIAQHCLAIGNFSTFMQVMSAIEHTSICRLKKSWCYVSKHAKYQLQELKKISSTDNKFKALRDATRRHPLPCVPYLGPMLNELVVLSEVNKTYLEPKDGIEQINFNKMHQLNHTISNILHYSQELYEFEYNRDILKSLLWVKEVDENMLYSLSEQLEAK
ncbi:ras-specific guanine nucleotide-releasing factor 2-like isoform X1 [Dysidea avara]|uniref:ras-specific guanine nucleotide-releasing factor 2-like isoform X1 n=2 Tax=Dysidea avara TaxID=196820 RepID=UPI00331FB275